MIRSNDCVQVNLRITTNSNQGARKYMEDAHTIALQRVNSSDKESPISLAYFGVFDGHGGKEAAEFARQHLCRHILEQDDFWPNTTDENEYDQSVLSAIRKGFLSCHNDMWNHVEKWTKTSSGLPSTSGSTASVVFIRGSKIYIGHVGDSAIVLGEGETMYKPWSATRLTRDHKPEDPLELERIRESGGNVLCKAGVHRVVWNRQKVTSNSSHSYRNRHQHSITTITTNGTTIEYEQIPFLAVSRALGDLWSLNRTTNLYSVSPEPELAVIEIDPNKHRCIILASDGLWNMISPESAIEIVRNCDIKTEEMILRSEIDDHRPFRNPSHELVQKALTIWRERMLRSDNITCVTVMLDPPGPPFSDCIVKKKKERLTYSMSSSTASVCSDDTVELNNLSPINSTNTPTTSQRIKPPLERNGHILTPISNGPTPIRNFKRPASDDVSTLPIDGLRRKLIKTNQQKENGRTSSSSNPTSQTETETLSSLSTTTPIENEHTSSITSETIELPIINDNVTDDNPTDKLEQSEDGIVNIEQTSLNLIDNQNDDEKKKSSQNHVGLSTKSTLDELRINNKRMDVRRARSISTTIITTSEISYHAKRTRRQKSFSSTHSTNLDQIHEIDNNVQKP